MNLIEIAEDELAKSIEKANRADDFYQAALDLCGVGRWDWKPDNPKISVAYEAKVKADKAMHEAFDKVRAIRRATER